MFSVLTPEDDGKTNYFRQQVIRGTACSECRRRKVACENRRPCMACISAGTEDRCTDVIKPQESTQFKKKKKKKVISSKHYQKLIETLFPDTSVDQLLEMTKSELIDSAVNNRKTIKKNGRVLSAMNINSLISDNIETYGWDESTARFDQIEDDANGLQIARHPSSFVGATSVSCLMKVIFKLLERFYGSSDLFRAGGLEKINFITNTPSASPVSMISRNSPEEFQLVNAYFEYVHPVFPIIDETSFRSACHSSLKKSESWMTLYYMVLAWGSIAISDGNSTKDIEYYNAASLHFTSLDRGSLEILQALILMGGHYLHYRSMPNTASVLTGAAFKIACGLGLHRKVPPEILKSISLTQQRLRKRIWWALYVTEVSATTGVGRPCIFSGEGVNIDIPDDFDDAAEILADEEQIMSVRSLVLDSSLCKILERVLCLYQREEFPEEDEAMKLDEELKEWYERTPEYLKHLNETSPGAYDALFFVKLRYCITRLMTFRAFLLQAAITGKCTSDLSYKSRKIVEQCREISAYALNLISDEWQPRKISSWGAVWTLFQAALIPLLTLYMEDRHDPVINTSCRAHIDKTLRLLDQMKHFRGGFAAKTIEVVQKLYDIALNLPEKVIFFSDFDQNFEDLLWGDSRNFLHQDSIAEYIWNPDQMKILF